MPIQSMTTTPLGGHMIHLCSACGAAHTISFDRGGQKSKTGPIALEVDDTLMIRVDASPPATVSFVAGDFPDFARVTAAQLAAKLRATLPGIDARDDAGGLLIESSTTGEGSRLQILGGTACTALGFPTGIDPCLSRPVLGISFGDGQQDKNVIALRRCNDCGANECLVRTFDAAPPEFAGTHFHEHRKAVNALAQHYKTSGWSHPHVVEHHAAETVRPVDVATEFPSQALRLPPFPRHAPGDTATAHAGSRP
jgi:hypothetical protein